MAKTRSRRVYQGSDPANQGKLPTAAVGDDLIIPSTPTKKVTEEDAESFMKVIKASEYKVLIAAQVSKETAPERIEKTVSSIFSNQISFAEDELPSKGYTHLRALHIVCKCNNHIVGQILEIPDGFSLLLGRPWIHAAGTVPSSLHQKLKFFAECKLITVNGEEDYAIYKDTAVPYVNIGEDQNFPFHSFDIISVIRDYGEVGPSRADRMIGKESSCRSKWRNIGIEGDWAFASLAMRLCKHVATSTSIISSLTTRSSPKASQSRSSRTSFRNHHMLSEVLLKTHFPSQRTPPLLVPRG
ncbi:hypothetical protein CRG98_001984 [Punica granatum]|uniref:Uncharacterized protein n=1 Tax=Punica granatum TaxID=22663 RepID=A0A2I0LBT2_PUNGR|nr:hypothetical protein CRG98_001984 [Punica granatum]